MARLVYTKPEITEPVSFKSDFAPVSQAIGSMKLGATGERMNALALVDSITLALQVESL